MADSSRGVDPAACSLQGMAADQLTSEWPGHGVAKVPSIESIRFLSTRHWIRLNKKNHSRYISWYIVINHVILATRSKCCTEHHLMACLVPLRSYLTVDQSRMSAMPAGRRWNDAAPCQKECRLGRRWGNNDGMNNKKLNECCYRPKSLTQIPIRKQLLHY